MEFAFLTRQEKQQMEADEKYYRSLIELEEQSCLNRLNAEMNCKETCNYYGTVKCRHPEKVFPRNQKRY